MTYRARHGYTQANPQQQQQQQQAFPRAPANSVSATRESFGDRLLPNGAKPKSKFYCDICLIDCENEGAMTSHVKGRAHKNRMRTQGLDPDADSKKARSVKHELRPYQAEGLAAAIDHNTILNLPTGYGKTLVGLHATKHFMDKDTRRRVLFVVATKSDAKDAVDLLQAQVGVQATIAVGGVPSTRDEESFRRLLKHRSALVSTPSLMQLALEKQWCRLSEFSLVIFDPINAIGGVDPMSKFVARYSQCLKIEAADGGSAPHVLALTSAFFGTNLGQDGVVMQETFEYLLEARLFTPSFPTNFERSNRVNRIFYEADERSSTRHLIADRIVPAAEEIGRLLSVGRGVAQNACYVSVSVGLHAVTEFLKMIVRESGCNRAVLNECNQQVRSVQDAIAATCGEERRLSSKATMLVSLLKELAQEKDAGKGVVIVEFPAIAQSLAQIMNETIPGFATAWLSHSDEPIEAFKAAEVGVIVGPESVISHAPCSYVVRYDRIPPPEARAKLPPGIPPPSRLFYFVPSAPKKPDKAPLSNWYTPESPNSTPTSLVGSQQGDFGTGGSSSPVVAPYVFRTKKVMIDQENAVANMCTILGRIYSGSYPLEVFFFPVPTSPTCLCYPTPEGWRTIYNTPPLCIDSRASLCIYAIEDMFESGFIDDNLTPNEAFAADSRRSCPVSSLARVTDSDQSSNQHPTQTHHTAAHLLSLTNEENLPSTDFDESDTTFDNNANSQNQNGFGFSGGSYHMDPNSTDNTDMLHGGGGGGSGGASNKIHSNKAFKETVRAYLSQRYASVQVVADDAAAYDMSYVVPSTGEQHFVTVCGKRLQVSRRHMTHARLNPTTHHVYCYMDDEMVVIDSFFTKLVSGALEFDCEFYCNNS
eukprot:PhM_4_TR15662/c4_g1_i1/m.3392